MELDRPTQAHSHRTTPLSESQQQVNQQAQSVKLRQNNSVCRLHDNLCRTSRCLIILPSRSGRIKAKLTKKKKAGNSTAVRHSQ